MKTVIAIDGPSASGKSTVARRVATALGWLYVDSGALYRGITWKALGSGLDVNDSDQVAGLLKEVDLGFFVEAGAVRFRIGAVAPGKELRTKEIDEAVSWVAAMPSVRLKVVGWLKDLTRFGSLVMEGRDIGTAVFPDAELKFYLDASPRERARRRHVDMTRAREAVSVTDVSERLLRRDAIDKGRGMDPLVIASGAMVIDSTSLSIDESVERILTAVSGRTP
jgi:cytidylate kinase